MKYSEILKESIDLHVHVGPELIPRKFSVSSLIQYEKGKLKGIGIKNHFFPTIGMLEPENIPDTYPFIIYSVVLNHYVGGFNSSIVAASAALSPRPIIVWLSTLHTKEFLDSHEFEIPFEWLDKTTQSNISLKKTRDIPPLTILDDLGNILPEVIAVLEEIKKSDAVLATGHISWQESVVIVRYAVEILGLKKIIITHPIYQPIAMPIDIQKQLAVLGAKMEHTYSMYSIDKIPIERIAQQIKAIGAKHCILSSDVGQSFSKSPSEALDEFLGLLETEGISEQEMRTMLITNPTELINKKLNQA